MNNYNINNKSTDHFEKQFETEKKQKNGLKII
jgi:hypothetical protein